MKPGLVSIGTTGFFCWNMPSLKIYANMANLALIKSSAKNAIIGFCEVKGLYHFYKPMSLNYALYLRGPMYTIL